MPELLESYGNVKIMEGEVGQIPYYIYLSPELSDVEKRIISDARGLIGNYKEVKTKLDEIHNSNGKEDYLRSFIRSKIDETKTNPENLEYIVSSIIDDLFLGYGRLGPLMRDELLEEIMVNGINTPVFVVHRKYGMCVTNILFDRYEAVNDLIHWLAHYVGRELNELNPLLDAHMPDGSRANVAISPAAPYGPAVTIRKFKRVPYNMLDLIEKGSATYELAAFLWVCVEGFGLSPIDLIIAGGAGSGKTTLMNAMAMFIPKTERVITVEDTLELNFDFIDNWVPLEASSATTVDMTHHISMPNLLKNSLRMRPDRVIVGEVRGNEAETLFVAMDIGLDGSMGTLHANNARETTIRLMEPPMNVPLRMMPLLNLIVVMNRIYDRKRGMMRRITQVSEVSGIEGDLVQLGEIYTYDIANDIIKRTEYPILLTEKIARECGITKKRLTTELLIREKVLQYMMAKGIRENSKVIKFFQRYHSDPKLILSELKASNQFNIQPTE
ncbi:MAG: ATPase, T2SS/T4P/T4SS family [Candidatus Altiarchaeota archaeon]